MTQQAPTYWMKAGRPDLSAAVKAFLDGEMTATQFGIFRDYLVHWINAGAFVGPVVEDLRQRVDHLSSPSEMRAWIDDATEAGCDPL